MSPPYPADDAFEILGAPQPPGPFVLTCEHASNRLPDGIVAAESDRPLLDDHWGWDIGARNLTVALLDRLGGQAVLSRFSRLVVDPNRDPGDAGYIVTEVDGRPVTFNQQLDQAERRRRTERLFEPYHAAIDRTLAARKPTRLVAIHSFTPTYRGQPRAMEVGVLFDRFDDKAEAVARALTAEGFVAALNEPYSGKPPQGLIYSAQRHGLAHEIEYLELEVRQDLIDTPPRARAVAERVARALAAFS